MLLGLLLLLLPLQEPPQEKVPEKPPQEAPSEEKEAPPAKEEAPPEEETPPAKEGAPPEEKAPPEFEREEPQKLPPEGKEPPKKRVRRAKKKKEEMPKNFKRATQKEIDAAIDRGAEFILKAQEAGGQWAMGPEDLSRHTYKNVMGDQAIGHTALMLLALLHAGIPTDHEGVQRAFKYLLERRDDNMHTYNCSLTLMAIEQYVQRLPQKGRKKKAKPQVFRKQPKDLQIFVIELAYRLYYGQLEDGTWTYRAARGKLDIKDLGTGIQSSKDKFKKPRAPRAGGDLSNMQYALLGLRAATELGVRMPPDVWAKAARGIIDRQEQKEEPEIARFPVPAASQPWSRRVGSRKTKVSKERRKFIPRGWGYFKDSGRRKPYGAMVTIGVASLAICKHYGREARSIPNKLRKKIDAGIENGCAWLVENYSVLSNRRFRDPVFRYRRPEGKIDGYYMYGVERAGILSGVQYFGTHDWYAEGARYLVDHQSDEGGWSCPMFYEPKDTISTAFAVLFLKRATEPTVPKRIETGGDH